jgi:Protein of unknown function (DUF664)
MTSVVSRDPAVKPVASARPQGSRRAAALAERLVEGAEALYALASGLSEADWQTRLPKDGRKIGVIVNHVAWIYPVEIQVAQTLASGQPVVGLVWDDVHALNAKHAKEADAAGKVATLDLLQRNSAEAAAYIRGLSDEDLDRAAPASLYSDAPVTCQFMLEDHAVRHSYHHLMKIRAALGR